MSVLISWTNKKIVHKKSTIEGEGVFAVAPIEAGELVAVFGGYSIDINSLNSIAIEDPDAYSTILSIGYQVDDEIIYAPMSEAQYSAIEYLNHSCDANSGFSSAIHLVALQNIMESEEITMDYGTCITSELFEMDCTCGAPLCRKKVTKDDWLLDSVQEKYGSHFQPYILKKILANKKL